MANRWQSTTLVDEVFKKDDINKVALDLLQKVNTAYAQPYPVGALYEQFSTQPAPAKLYVGTTWSDITKSLPQSVTTAVYASGTGFIQWTDGTMQQWGTYSATTATAYSAFFYAPNVTVTFPIQFTATPVLVLGANLGGSVGNPFYSSYGPSTFLGSILTSNNLTTYTCSWQAFGKWSLTPVYPTTYWVRTN